MNLADYLQNLRDPEGAIDLLSHSPLKNIKSKQKRLEALQKSPDPDPADYIFRFKHLGGCGDPLLDSQGNVITTRRKNIDSIGRVEPGFKSVLNGYPTKPAVDQKQLLAMQWKTQIALKQEREKLRKLIEIEEDKMLERKIEEERKHMQRLYALRNIVTERSDLIEQAKEVESANEQLNAIEQSFQKPETELKKQIVKPNAVHNQKMVKKVFKFIDDSVQLIEPSASIRGHSDEFTLDSKEESIDIQPKSVPIKSEAVKESVKPQTIVKPPQKHQTTVKATPVKVTTVKATTKTKESTKARQKAKTERSEWRKPLPKSQSVPKAEIDPIRESTIQELIKFSKALEQERLQIMLQLQESIH